KHRKGNVMSSTLHSDHGLSRRAFMRIVGLGSLAMPLLAACQPSLPATAPTSAPPKPTTPPGAATAPAPTAALAPTTAPAAKSLATIMFWDFETRPQAVAAQDAWFDRAGQVAGVKVQREVIPIGETDKKVLAATATSTLPDMIWANP